MNTRTEISIPQGATIFDLIADGSFENESRKAYIKAINNSALSQMIFLLNMRVEAEKRGEDPDQPMRERRAHPEAKGVDAVREERMDDERKDLDEKFSPYAKMPTNFERCEAWNTVHAHCQVALDQCNPTPFDSLMTFTQMLKLQIANNAPMDVSETELIEAMERSLDADPEKALNNILEARARSSAQRRENAEAIVTEATALSIIVDGDDKPAIEEAFEVLTPVAQHNLLIAAASAALRPERKVNGKPSGGGAIAVQQRWANNSGASDAAALVRCMITDVETLLVTAKAFMNARQTQIRNSAMTIRGLTDPLRRRLIALQDMMVNADEYKAKREAAAKAYLAEQRAAPVPAAAPNNVVPLPIPGGSNPLAGMIQTIIAQQIQSVITQQIQAMFSPAPHAVSESAPPAAPAAPASVADDAF